MLSKKEAESLTGDRWHPTADSSAAALRVPTAGTLDALGRRHEQFLGRLSDRGFEPVPPLAAFAVVGYRRDADPVRRPVAAFQLLTPDASGFLPFDPVRRTHVVAGMVRHAAKIVAKLAEKDDDWINSFVLGHGDGPRTQARGDRRFAYLPLPSVSRRGVGDVRRVLVAEPPGGPGHDARWLARALAGADLVRDGTPVGLLSVTPPADPVVRRYVPAPPGAATWCTVTPVVLPGHDEAGPGVVAWRRQWAKSAADRRAVAERAAGRTERLLRRAVRQAGFPAELADRCDLEWRPAGFLPGVGLAGRYAVPPYLGRFPRYHVRLTWRDGAGRAVRVPGPVAVGAGRYCGLGLFAACD